jgi:hypothetical protein
MRALLLISFLITAACATEAKYDAKLRSFVGKPESELIAKWGIPDGSYEMPNGRRAIVYQDSRAIMVVGRVANRRCKTTFFVEYKIIRNWEAEGNDCISE